MRNYYGAENKVLVAVDCIIFGFDQQEEELKLLLVKRDIPPELGKWSLMGGFMLHDETLDDAAIRVLYDLTGLRNIYMEQLRVFSKVDRDPVARTLSVAYFALINIEDHDKHLIQNYGAKWFSINRKPILILTTTRWWKEQSGGCGVVRLPIRLALNCCRKNSPCASYRSYMKPSIPKNWTNATSIRRSIA